MKVGALLKFRRAVAPPSENVAICVMPKSICTMLINDSSISIEFTQRTKLQSLWKFRKVTVYEITYLNKCSKLHVCRRTEADNAWQELSQSFIDRSINEWRRRLECVVHHNGGHIEYLLK